MVRLATRMPSFNSSPRILSAPPTNVVSRHPTDERNDLGTEVRSTRPSSPGTPSPPESESFAVPAKHSLGLHQKQGAAPRGNEHRKQDEQSAFTRKKSGSLDGAGRDDELLPKHRVFGDELPARPTFGRRSGRRPKARVAELYRRREAPR